ncbi:MAG: hypothetical protein ACTHKG_20320 [Nocardioides sp.]
MRRIRAVTAVVLLLATGGLSGCGGDDEPTPDYPADAVRLRQNVPTPLDGRTLTAINIDGDEGTVVVVPAGGGEHTNVPVAEGDTAEADGLRFDVVDVVEADSSGDEPGAPGGLIVIVPSS